MAFKRKNIKIIMTNGLFLILRAKKHMQMQSSIEKNHNHLDPIPWAPLYTRHFTNQLFIVF